MLIKLEKISKSYDNKGDRKILKDVDVTINSGDFVTIIGKSGSGKTTLLNILGTIDKFDTGSYKINGKEICNMKKKELANIRREQFGFVFQSYQLINELSVKDNVIMPMGYAGISRKDREERAIGLLKNLDLEGKLNSFPSQLSGGEKQRVAIARALANKPKILLADEPTGNLDEVNTKLVMDIFKELNKKGITIIMVTHDLSLKGYSSRTLVIENGRVKEFI